MVKSSETVQIRPGSIQAILGLVLATLRLVEQEIDQFIVECGIVSGSLAEELQNMARPWRAIVTVAELLKSHPSSLEQER